MKKFSVLVLGILVGSGLCLSGCASDLKSDVTSNLSDVRYSIFAGETSGARAFFMSGLRENPYGYDGVSNKKTQFGLVELWLDTKPETNPHFTVTVGQKTFAGVLEENPYNHTYMADIGKILESDEGVFLTVEGVMDNMQLVAVSEEWQVQYASALEIAVAELEQELSALYEKRKFQGECYLKIACPTGGINQPYYWCFSYVGQNGESGSIMIDVNSGEILGQA